MSRESPGPVKQSESLISVIRWFDSEAGLDLLLESQDPGVDWWRILPFAISHVMCLGVFLVGWSWVAVAVAAGLYLVRMFAITGFYHRYFSHRTFKTNRFWQFIFAVLGNSSVQRGPLWWAAHHRHHHRYADQDEDPHSPSRHGFWHSHIGWLTTRTNFRTRMEYVGDWAKYPELVWINRFDTVIPILLALTLLGLGEALATFAPGLNTNGPQMLIWGFFISTVVLFHGTSTINSLDHLIGTRRYDTPDTSRNNLALALITLGEGWHNNHHHYAVTARQGFYWWEIDITYYLLVLLSWLGIVTDLRPIPESVRSRNQFQGKVRNEEDQA
ncbi:MAG: acyl-CoA desaturase [Deltaproteobacteria bacterium]|nr:MAG: acyl-CoA desaturase [Deltaproteobacteria bacterium]